METTTYLVLTFDLRSWHSERVGYSGASFGSPDRGSRNTTIGCKTTTPVGAQRQNHNNAPREVQCYYCYWADGTSKRMRSERRASARVCRAWRVGDAASDKGQSPSFYRLVVVVVVVYTTNADNFTNWYTANTRMGRPYRAATLAYAARPVTV